MCLLMCLLKTCTVIPLSQPTLPTCTTLSYLLYQLMLLKNIDATLVSSLVADPVCFLVNDTIDKVSSILASSLVTDMAYILTNDTLKNIDSILASSLVPDMVSILMNGTIDKVSSTSMSILVNDAASILSVSSLVIDAVNINLILPLFPFPNTPLPFSFHCIIGIDFNYYPLLYHNCSAWIESTIPILRLLISSFHLKYIVIMIIFVLSRNEFLLLNQQIDRGIFPLYSYYPTILVLI